MNIHLITLELFMQLGHLYGRILWYSGTSISATAIPITADSSEGQTGAGIGVLQGTRGAPLKVWWPLG